MQGIACEYNSVVDCLLCSSRDDIFVQNGGTCQQNDCQLPAMNCPNMINTYMTERFVLSNSSVLCIKRSISPSLLFSVIVEKWEFQVYI